MTKAKKIFLLVSIVLIVVGIVLYFVMGFNYNLEYGDAKRITVSMKDDFSLEDYKSFAKEIYGNAQVEAISTFKSGVSIKVKDTNDEQLDKLVSKINEKYGYEYTKDDLKVTKLTQIKIWDLLKQALIPVVSATLIIFVYILIRYRKQSFIKLLLSSFVPEVLSVLLVLSVYLVFRIPVTNMLLPIILSAYAISVICTARQFKK